MNCDQRSGFFEMNKEQNFCWVWTSASRTTVADRIPLENQNLNFNGFCPEPEAVAMTGQNLKCSESSLWFCSVGWLSPGPAVGLVGSDPVQKGTVLYAMTCSGCAC